MVTLDQDSHLPPVSEACFFCTHLQGFRRCEAFGAKPIPLEIWEGRNAHAEPFPGDHGIQFERTKRD